MAKKPLSMRAYAAHRKALGLPGGSLQAVQRAIEAERITVVTVDGARRIPDPEAADREWAVNTDHSRSPGSVKDQAGDPSDDELDAYEGADPQAPSMKLEAALEKRAKRKLAELALGEKAGSLVNAEDVEDEVAEAFSLVRTKLLGLPSKAKQRLPHLTLADLATLDAIVREALEALARESHADEPADDEQDDED